MVVVPTPSVTKAYVHIQLDMIILFCFLIFIEIVVFLLIGNFVGVACARTLHYQFYVWYFHSLAALLWITSLPIPIRLGLLAIIEYIWNAYPPAPVTSLLLQICHAVITIALLVVNPATVK